MPKGPIQFQRMVSEFMYVFRKSKRKVVESDDEDVGRRGGGKVEVGLGLDGILDLESDSS